MKITRFGGEGYAANGYAVTDDAGTATILVDPVVSPDALPDLPPISTIILTHAHFDHMLTVNEWRQKTVAPLAVHRWEAPALGNADLNVYRLFTGGEGGTAPAEILLDEGSTLHVGEERLTVWHTPGHTPGSICLLGDGFLITGDTLFAGTIGRTDLPGGREQDMRASLGRLFRLPDDLTLYPGHGPATTLTREKKYNPYAQWSE